MEAGRRIARAEDGIVSDGQADGDMFGLCPTAEHEPIPAPDDPTDYPEAVARAVNGLRSAGVGERTPSP